MRYNEISRALHDSGIKLTIEECHAIVVAQVCLNAREADWVSLSRTLLEKEDDGTAQKLELIFLALRPVVLESIQDIHMDFRLLLPEENDELFHRVVGFGKWCSGLLTGFALSKEKTPIENPQLNDDARSFLQNLSRFADLISLDNIEHDDLNENDLDELIEYCRLNVIHLFLELNPRASNPVDESDRQSRAFNGND